MELWFSSLAAQITTGHLLFQDSWDLILHSQSARGADIGSVFFSDELLTVHASCTKVVGYLENRIDTMHKNAPMLPSIRNAQEMHMISQTPRNCQGD